MWAAPQVTQAPPRKLQMPMESLVTFRHSKPENSKVLKQQQERQVIDTLIAEIPTYICTYIWKN